jgi:hypothetical protein
LGQILGTTASSSFRAQPTGSIRADLYFTESRAGLPVKSLAEFSSEIVCEKVVEGNPDKFDADLFRLFFQRFPFRW